MPPQKVWYNRAMKDEMRILASKIRDSIESSPIEKSNKIHVQLLNLVEMLLDKNDTLKKENQQLKDENNRLKGEQGKPNIRKQTKSSPKHSSEKERGENKGKPSKKKKSKTKKITINKTTEIEVAEDMPADAQFKGYETRIIQDIKITPDNIEFKLKKYYSPSLKKTFVAKLPGGYRGGFGINIRSQIYVWKHDLGLTNSAIAKLLKNHGMQISSGTINTMLIGDMEIFHQEKEDIVTAGMKSSSFQQIDDTGAKVKGKNWYTHILCNPFYTAFFSREKKNRLTVLDIFMRGNMQFIVNQRSLELMKALRLSEKQLQAIQNHEFPIEPISRALMDKHLKELYPKPKKMKQAQRIVLESCAISCAEHFGLLPKILVADEAPQFTLLAQYAAACWVHDGRHYKKLTPYFTKHQKLIDEFLEKYWGYYRKLLAFTKAPTDKVALELTNKFDELFSTSTDYCGLNDRIEKTMLKKESLLLALKFADVPLHNNASELGARKAARNRDISFHCMSERGRKALDTGNTIVETARKLGVNISEYFKDRVGKTNVMKSLADMIADKALIPT